MARTTRLPPLLLGLLCAGCATVGSRQHTFGEIARRCEAEGQAVWLEPRPKLEGLLVMGRVEDPSTAHGRLVPVFPPGYAYEAEQWMREAGVSSIDMLMRPARPADADHLYGPVRGEPDGVYRFSLLPGERPECGPYYAAYRIRVRPTVEGGPPLAPRPDTCVTWTYRGPLDLTVPRYVFLSYEDVSVRSAHAYREVIEIRRGPDHAVARAVLYKADSELTFAPECFHRSGRYMDWFKPPADPAD
jgi:hypothetical protein